MPGGFCEDRPEQAGEKEELDGVADIIQNSLVFGGEHVQVGGDVPEEIDEADDKDEVEGLFPEVGEEGQDSWYQREECNSNKKIVNKAISGSAHNAYLLEMHRTEGQKANLSGCS